MYVLLDNDCSIGVYQSFVAIFQNVAYYACIILNAFSVTYYAQIYAGIISWTLHKYWKSNT